MAINLPTPRAQPEEEVWFIAIKPEALGINYNISHLIGSLLAHAQALSQGHYGNKETNQN